MAERNDNGKKNDSEQPVTSHSPEISKSGDRIPVFMTPMVKHRNFMNDPDYANLTDWSIDSGTHSGISYTHVDRDDANRALTKDDVTPLQGRVILVEGGIGQGKTTALGYIKSEIEALGITCHTEEEPVDHESLRLFMKYGVGITDEELAANYATSDRNVVDPNKSVHERCYSLLKTEAAQKSAIRMQFSMLRRRMECSKRGAEMARKGAVVLLDRSAIGDTVFMHTTFDKFRVNMETRMRYIAEFQRLYCDIGFPTVRCGCVLVRIKAPVDETHVRWLQREGAVDGPKYPKGYLSMLETAYDAVCRSWGSHVVYDNSHVGSGNVSCEKGARALILTIRDFVKSHSLSS
jgi:thymidylate kinase